MSEREQEFYASLADVLETPSIAPGDDYRTTALWGSLTAFALKVMLQQRFGVTLTLQELDAFPSAEALLARAVS